MNPERWQKVNELFDAALARSEIERESFLSEACGSDLSLREEVRSLLAFDEKEPAFLKQPTAQRLESRVEDGPTDASEGSLLGAYRLRRRLASGGMGTVWLAERADEQYHQRVAVKVIKRGMDSDEILDRFRNERQVLAGCNIPTLPDCWTAAQPITDRPIW